MSPSWTERLRIALSPDGVALLHLGRGWRPRAKAHRHETLTRDATCSWQPALEAMARLIAVGRPPHAALEVVLSNYWVRYAVIPWNDQVTRTDERLALARLQFQKTFGDVALQWDIRLSAADYGAPQVAAAVDRELMNGLRLIAEQTRLRLDSVQPLLMAGYNLRAAELARADTAWFVVAEPGRFTVAYRQQGQWSTVFARPISDSPADGLNRLVTQERLRRDSGTSATGERYWLFSADPVTPPEIADLTWHTVQVPSPPGIDLRHQPEYAFAAC